MKSFKVVVRNATEGQDLDVKGACQAGRQTFIGFFHGRSAP